MDYHFHFFFQCTIHFSPFAAPPLRHSFCCVLLCK